MANGPVRPAPSKNTVWWLIGLIIIALLIWWFFALPAIR